MLALMYKNKMRQQDHQIRPWVLYLSVTSLHSCVTQKKERMAEALTVILREGWMNCMLSGQDLVQLYRCGTRSVGQVVRNTTNVHFFADRMDTFDMGATLCKILVFFPNAKNLSIKYFSLLATDYVAQTWTLRNSTPRAKVLPIKNNRLEHLKFGLPHRQTLDICLEISAWLADANNRGICLFPNLHTLDLNGRDGRMGAFINQHYTLLDLGSVGTLTQHMPKLGRFVSGYECLCSISRITSTHAILANFSCLSITCRRQGDWDMLVEGGRNLVDLTLYAVTRLLIQRYPPQLTNFTITLESEPCEFDCQLPAQLVSFRSFHWEHILTNDWFHVSRLPRGLQVLSLRLTYDAEPDELPNIFGEVDWPNEWPTTLSVYIDTNDDPWDMNTILGDVHDAIVNAASTHPNVAYTYASLLAPHILNVSLATSGDQWKSCIEPFFRTDDAQVILMAIGGILQSRSVCHRAISLACLLLAHLGRRSGLLPKNSGPYECACSAVRHYGALIAPFVNRAQLGDGIQVKNMLDWVFQIYVELRPILWPSIPCNDLNLVVDRDGPSPSEQAMLKNIEATGSAHASSITLICESFDDHVLTTISALPSSVQNLILRGATNNFGHVMQRQVLERLPASCRFLTILSDSVSTSSVFQIFELAASFDYAQLRQYHLFVNHTRWQTAAWWCGLTMRMFRKSRPSLTLKIATETIAGKSIDTISTVPIYRHIGRMSWPDLIGLLVGPFMIVFALMLLPAAISDLVALISNFILWLLALVGLL